MNGSFESGLGLLSSETGHVWWQRVFALGILERSGWLPTGFLQGLVTRSSSDGTCYTLSQLVTVALRGLELRSESGRDLLAPLTGPLPYLGAGVFTCQPLGDSTDLACTPQEFESRLAQALDRLSQKSPLDIEEEVCMALRPGRAVRGAILHHLVDSNCNCGDALVEAIQARAQELAQCPQGPDRLQETLRTELVGVTTSETKAHWTASRVAFAAWRSAGRVFPLPDLRLSVRVGAPASLEGHNTEFKSGFEWNARKGAKDRRMRLGVLKAVCAFLNAEGGTVRLGIADDGTVCGIEDELSAINDPVPQDIFEGKLREAFKNQIDPIPLNLVKVSFNQMVGHAVCDLTVSPGPDVYCLTHKDEAGVPSEDIFVRDGNRTIRLTGKDRDRFVLQRGQSQ